MLDIKKFVMYVQCEQKSGEMITADRYESKKGKLSDERSTPIAQELNNKLNAIYE